MCGLHSHSRHKHQHQSRENHAHGCGGHGAPTAKMLGWIIGIGVTAAMLYLAV